jgi:ADP-heptose:LPS heptosyltransferase
MILLFPWSRKTTDGRPSPKNYPYWAEVVKAFPDKVHQLSCYDEPSVPGCLMRSNDLLLAEIKNLLNNCNTWMSVDNFAHHLAWSIDKKGVAIFGSSDPNIFGHQENINILKDRRFLRQRQFGLWAEEQLDPKIFVSPDIVIEAVSKLLH